MKTRQSKHRGSQALMVVALWGALAGCAPLMMGSFATGVLVASDRRTSGTQLEDEGIELRAASRLREQLGERGHVNVTSYGRQVLLTGEVASEQDKAAAEQAIGRVDNVLSVVNELAVREVSSLSQRSSDTLLTGRVKASFVDARDISASSFKVVTERGVVYLMGRVTQREATRATDITRSVSGVARVVRMLDLISEEELARMQPKPAPAKAPVSGGQ